MSYLRDIFRWTHFSPATKAKAHKQQGQSEHLNQRVGDELLRGWQPLPVLGAPVLSHGTTRWLLLV